MEDYSGNFIKKYHMIGASDKMIELYDNMGKIAPRGDTKVLIRGERGTGKELVAKAIHDNSPRKEKPYVVINCAAFQPTLLESEMFGHEKGSFTDAHKQKIGKFQYADGGTIFMDEIADLSLEIQPKLLRAIEYGEFQRVGGNETITADVRLIAATSKDIEKLIHQDKFRHELYDRINVFPLFVPPLRERGNDIYLLIQYFMDKYGGREILPDALNKLTSYKWPGNVRQLESAIERLVISGGGEISPDLVDECGVLVADGHPASQYLNVLQESHADFDFPYKELGRLEAELGHRIESFVSELSFIRKFQAERKKKIDYYSENFLDPKKTESAIIEKMEKFPVAKHRKKYVISAKNKSKDYMTFYDISKTIGISYSTLAGVIRQESKKPRENRHLKYVQEDNEIIISFDELAGYFEKIGNKKAFSALDGYKKSNPEKWDIGIRIKKRPRGKT